MRSIASHRPKHLGEMRTSQLVTSYGVGAMLDFREDSAILAEADGWYRPERRPEDREREIHCHTLEMVLRKRFFVRPRWDPYPRAIYQQYHTQDIGAFRFPQMLYCPQCNRLTKDRRPGGAREKAPVCAFPDCKGSRLVPSRFVVVCARGHLDEFPYDAWVHRGGECPKREKDNPRLKLKNMDGRNSISSLQVICDDCGAVRSMQGALAPGGLKSVCTCSGRRPWLSEEYDPRPCPQEPTARLRTAAGVYMPVNVSALNIPPWSTRISRILQPHSDVLTDRSDAWALDYIQKKIIPLAPDMEARQVLDEWRCMEQRNREGRPQNEQQLYEDEYLALCGEAGEADEGFASVEKSVPQKYAGLIHRVFAINRLTEVVAMLGFTRLRRWDGEYDSAALAPIFSNRNLPWLPAVEQKGEGIFLELDEAAIEKWETQNGAVYEEMMQNAKENHFRCDNLSPRYILLHTLSHLLIRALAANCGYQTSSMKERIYSTYVGGKPMAGILVYTTTADTEGSLGGIVGQTEHLGEHLDALLNEASWCSSDPLCLVSIGKNAQGLWGLNYGACPQCTLLPETACVMRNSLLDRGALIGRDADFKGYFSTVL